MQSNSGNPRQKRFSLKVDETSDTRRHAQIVPNATFRGSQGSCSLSSGACRKSFAARSLNKHPFPKVESGGVGVHGLPAELLAMYCTSAASTGFCIATLSSKSVADLRVSSKGARLKCDHVRYTRSPGT